MNNPQNITVFKLVVLAILIFIFISIATIKIWELRIIAERTGVVHTVGTLQSAIGIQIAERVTKRGITSLAELHLSNPIELLDENKGQPRNYLGEFYKGNAPGELGTWYFDLGSKTLIYRVRFTDHFESSNHKIPAQAHYQLSLGYRDNNNNHQFDIEVDRITGLSLKPLAEYRWLKEADSK